MNRSAASSWSRQSQRSEPMRVAGQALGMEADRDVLSVPRLALDQGRVLQAALLAEGHHLKVPNRVGRLAAADIATQFGSGQS